jgi:hypothetical protein
MEQQNKVLKMLEERTNKSWESLQVAKANLEAETNPKYKRMFKKMVNDYRSQWHALSQTLYVIKRDLGI